MTAPHYKPMRSAKLRAYHRALVVASRDKDNVTDKLFRQATRVFELAGRELQRTGCYLHYGGQLWHACPGAVKGACDHE